MKLPTKSLHLPSRVKLLRRYTSLPVLLDMLVHKRITLVSPTSWEDRNDAYYLERYGSVIGARTVLALCFTAREETFHHWKVFAGNPGGVCIRFHAERLVACFAGSRGVRMGMVSYRRTRDLRVSPPSPMALPFLKRLQYQDEEEFRVVYEEQSREFQSKDFRLNPKSIDRIILGPWLPRSVRESVVSVIRGIPECATLEVTRSGVVDYSAWKNVARRLSRATVTQ